MSLITTIKSLEKPEHAYRELFESNYDSMMSICNRYAKNIEQAKEMLKQGFISIFNQINLLSEEKAESQMKAMMIDSCVDILKKNAREYTIVSTVKVLDIYDQKKEDIIDEDIIATMKPEQVISAIQKLTPAYRVVINLFLVDNYSFLQIGEKLDIAESTVKMNYEKAMCALRKTVMQLSMHHA